MARLARVVIPGIPHHVTQRGNGRGQTFFEPGDYALYLDLLASAAERAQTEVWAYCLMPNHVHIVLTPSGVTVTLYLTPKLHHNFPHRVTVTLYLTPNPRHKTAHA
jgi:REP element-mobilizing transposase RayT